MYTNRFDSHMHSANSHDAFEPVTALCHSAIEQGLLGICITDHCECNFYEKLGCGARIKQSMLDAQQAREEFAGKLVISRGVELGQALENEAAAREVLALADYDFVLGSLHNNLGQTDFFYLNYSDPAIVVRDLMQQHYIELQQLAASEYCDVLAHLTYPLRYIWGKHRIPVRMEDYQELIDEVLRTAAQTGKGMEINTSGLRQGMGITLPSVKYIKRFREFGGEIVTIGSDAHRSEHVGFALDAGMEVLKEAGFKYVSFFRERKPVMFRLI